jgi:XTP/dITP diphosphohydrolase
MKLLFASHNPNKKKEIQLILSKDYEILDLNDLGFTEVIEETGKSHEENALLKARFLFNKLQIPCIAEDSGLEVDFLNGAPGVHSARFAGEEKNDLKNIQKGLESRKSTSNRKARFRTIIALIGMDSTKLFEGIVKGTIANEAKGTEGFGYDPIFIPDGFNQSFAELGTDIKNKISHRKMAVEKLIKYLQS